MPTPPTENSEAGLKTRHVFLDTEAYRRYGHNLSARVLQSLFKYIKDQVSILHITDITVAEIKRQIEEMAHEIAQNVNKANKQLKNWRKRSAGGAQEKEPEDVDRAELARLAVLHFNVAMRGDWKPLEHLRYDVVFAVDGQV